MVKQVLSKSFLIKPLIAVAFAAVAGVGIYQIASKKSHEAKAAELFEVDPAFASYVNGFTSGIVSTKTTVQIRFVESFVDSTKSEMPPTEDLFDFTPNVKGKTQWIDDRTIEFVPDEQLPFDQIYTTKFKLDKLFPIEEDKLKTFEFGFRTIPLYFEVENYGISYTGSGPNAELSVEGRVVCSDVVDSTRIAKVLAATQNGNQLPVKWVHDKEGKDHRFVIGNIGRTNESQSVKLAYTGNEFDVDISGEDVISIPALNKFSYLSHRIVQVPDQFVLISFSDPLDQQQDLSGLVRLGELDVDIDIMGNQIKVMPTTRQNGTINLYVDKGIKNFEGKEFEGGHTFSLQFEQLKPQVRWVGNSSGAILPTQGAVQIPIEAVGLKEIQVEVIRIYEKNIVQFLQTNNLGGNDELRRVGSPIKKETISLIDQGVANLAKWNRFTLDLTNLIQQEPGAIHQVRLFFSRQNAAYECENAPDFLESEGWQSYESEFSSWDSYNYYYSGGYDYQQRDNPCHPMYYRYHAQMLQRNFLASDIGVVAKKEKTGKLHFAVTNLLTAKPLANAKVDIYNFQQQVIGQVTTNSDGMAKADVEGTPFLAIASNGQQKTYLKLDNNTSLSTSHFNTSGTSNQEGYKGTIYGERGVWRPGDSLFLTFVLQDKDQLVPSGTPVVMEFTDPLNRLQDRIVKTRGVNGVYSFRMATPPDAPTGNWSAQVKLGNSVFYKTVPIETIKPNRLKINLDFGAEKLTALNPEINGKLQVKWLHGAIAKNLKAKIEAVVSGTSNHFEGYEKYQFDDIATNYSSESFEVFNGELNDEGEADVYTELNLNGQVPGRLIANMKTTVFEKSGNSSVDRFSIPYLPYPTYVGMRVPEGDRHSNWLQTDTPNTYDIVLLTADGKPLKETRDVKVEVYKMQWRWWWDRSYDNFSNYLSSSSSNHIHTGKAKIRNGKGKYTFTIDRPHWGRFYVRVTDTVSGHTAGRIVYYQWPWWAGRPAEQRGESVLEFSADKEKYNTGEKAHFKIPSTPEGRALISLENGSKVLKQFWITTSKGQTEFDVDLTPEMSPNVYVHATLLQPHANTENDLPIRLYGVANVNVEDPQTRFAPEINMPDVLRPEEEFEIKVSEASGRPMTYTVAIVDEGLLDLTRFKTPDLWSFFYAKEALGVETHDMFNDVIGAYSGELQRILGVGGGGDFGEKPEGSRVNRFKPVVKFIGPFELKKGESATHKIKMPYYVGSVRTMVVASQNGAYGSLEKTTPVRQPLMVLGTLPRVLGPGEEVLVPVSVFAMEEHVKNATVSITPNDIFEQIGASSQQVRFPKIGEEMAYFKLRVKETTGVGQVVISAVSGGEKARDQIDIEIRNPNPTVTKVYAHVLDANAAVDAKFESVGLVGTNTGAIEVSAIPPIDLEKRLKYLIRYPHGCIEQTTSSIFPQLYLTEVTEVSQEMQDEIERNIKAGIERLASFQTLEGGFSYWPGELEASTWGTNYAGHFLIEASRKGYHVPKSMLKNWRKYQKRMSSYYNKTENAWRNVGLEQAYRLYLLALNQTPEMGSMNRLRADNTISLQAKWRLAAAYAMAGQKETAKEMIQFLTYEILPYRELSYSYGSDLRDRAMILETLVELGETKKAALLMQSISNDMNQRHWMSTQTTAYCLLSVGKYAKNNLTRENINFNYTYKGFTQRNASTGLPIASVTMKDNEILSGSVKVTNLTGSVMYLRIITEGRPLTGDTTNAENDLKMTVAYKDMDGNSINPASIDQGTQFYADVTLSNPGLRNHYQEMALTQIFPSGWEIVNTRMDGTSNFYNASTPRYQDIRDDRVYTYYDLGRHQTKTFRIILTASFVGKYYLPAVSSDAMYDNTISAHRAGRWVEVKSASLP